MKKGVILLFTLVFIGVISFLIATSLNLSSQQRALANERVFLMQLHYLIKDSATLLEKTTCQAIAIPLEFDSQTLNIELNPQPQSLASVAKSYATNPDLLLNLMGNSTSRDELESVLSAYITQTGDEAFKYSLDSADFALTASNSTTPCLVKMEGELFGFEFNLHYIYEKGSDAKEIVYHYTPRSY